MFEAIMLLIAAVIALAVFASWKVMTDELATPAQKWLQFGFLWCVPIIGPLIAIQLKRRHPEKGTGTYREVPDAGDDFGDFSKPSRGNEHHD